jgi:hypothetical protein
MSQNEGAICMLSFDYFSKQAKNRQMRNNDGANNADFYAKLNDFYGTYNDAWQAVISQDVETVRNYISQLNDALSEEENLGRSISESDMRAVAERQFPIMEQNLRNLEEHCDKLECNYTN